jgi:hypothetical protein
LPTSGVPAKLEANMRAFMRAKMEDWLLNGERDNYLEQDLTKPRFSPQQP